MGRKVWVKTRDANGNVTELDMLDATTIFEFDGKFVQVVDGRPWVTIDPQDLAFSMPGRGFHQIKL